MTSNTLEPLTTNLDEVINPTQPITNQTLDVQVHDLDSITPTTNSNVSESNYDVQTSISESQNAVVVEPTASELVGQKIVSNLTNQNNSTDSTVLSTNSVDSHIKPMTIPVDLEEKMKFFYSQLLYPRELQEVDLSLKK